MIVFDLNKRGDSEETVWLEVVLIALTLAFAFLLAIFIKNTLSGALIQEEIYSKKIALLLDSAQPNTIISLDITKLSEISISSGQNRDSYRNIIKINEVNHSVDVSLRLGNKGYRYPYFSDYNISGNYTMAGDKILYIITIGENKDE